MTERLRADLLIYKRATRFEASYRQKMTGTLPEYPMTLPMQNPYTGPKLRNKRSLVDHDDDDDDDDYDDEDEEDGYEEDEDDEYNDEDDDEYNDRDDGDVDRYNDRSEYPEDGNDRDFSSDLSVLRGLEVGYDGLVYDEFNELVGHLVEGDPEYLVGHVINEYGEVLDAEGFAVGRVETSSPHRLHSRDLHARNKWSSSLTILHVLDIRMEKCARPGQALMGRPLR